MSDDSFREFVYDQLDGLGDMRDGRMFSAHGFYCDEVFFAILHKGRLFFKVDEASREDYVAAGVEAFQPTEKITLKSYFEVPVDVLENADVLRAWARRAIEAQKKSGGQKKKRKTNPLGRKGS